MTKNGKSPVQITLSLLATVVVTWLLFGNQFTAIQNIFTGPTPHILDSAEIDILRLQFEPGARSHWHSHSRGQLLLVEEGLGRTQIQGESVREMSPGAPVYAGPNVVHWHGAAPDESMVQLTIHSGEVAWGDAVSDTEYLATPIR